MLKVAKSQAITELSQFSKNVKKMPRRKQRYSRLLLELKHTGGGAGTDSRVSNFLNFITGKRKLTQTNTIPAAARELYKVGLYPFALTAPGTPTAADRYTARISAYSLKGIQGRTPEGTTISHFGMHVIESGEQENPNYYPALLRAKYSAQGASEAERTSDITGDKYKYKYGRTFSFPFGRAILDVKDATGGQAETTIDDADELDVLTSLRNRLNSPGDNREAPSSMSYEPEVYKPAPTARNVTANDENPGTFSVS